MMSAVLRLLLRFILFGAASAVLAGVAYSFTDNFADRWRTFVIDQFEERGVHLDFHRLGFSLAGLVAREVRIFSDPERKQMLVSMDRLNLDIDYGKLTEKQFFVEGLELSQANVSLPLDPADEKQGKLELTGFNARLYFMDDRLDIRRAEGDLAGVHVTISGSMLMPPRMRRSGGPKKDRTRRDMVDLKIIRDQREKIQSALLWLNRFTFAKRPQVVFDINGSLETPESLSATLQFDAEGVRYEGYVCKHLSATAEYHDHLLDVRRVLLRDSVGTFEASATWPVQGDEVQFRVATTADLPQIARSFFQNEELREVVIYQSSPPSLTLEGKWFIRGPKAGPKRPVEALGQIRFGRFTTRGEVFDGLAASFGVTPTGYYIRDAMLRHKTGSLSLQAMSQQVEGFKYRAVLKMDPHAFLPFASEAVTRDMIRRFEFVDTSTVFVQIEGSGTEASLAACMNKGRVELHDFKYQGIDFDSWSGDLEIFNRKLILRDVSMIPREGKAFAQQVIVDNDAKTVTLVGIKGKVDPVPLTSCFTRKVAESLVKYRFGLETEVELGGTIGFKDPKLNDFTIRFTAPTGTATYPLWNRDYTIQAPSGSFHIKGPQMTYDVKGRVFGGPMKATGHVAFAQPGYSVELEAGEFRQMVLGKDLPLTALKASVKSGDQGAPFNISGRVLGGALTMKGEMDKDSYKGELHLNAMSFERFAKMYTPSYVSEGDITGNFQFAGKPGDWKALRGSGVLIILNGNLYALPVLGPLTPLLGALLPSQIKGYNVAREASCNFSVGDGLIVTDDFEALTSAFKLVADGNVDFLNDNIDFTAQARVRGLPGLVLRPVSELLEFRGEGSIGKPHWRPRYLSIGSGSGKGDDRKAARVMEAEAERRAEEPKAEEPVERRRFAVPPLGRMGR